MSSTYSTNLAIELIGTGDQAGTWGTTTNSNLGTLIEQSISGYVTQAVSTGTDTTITIPNGSTGVARNMYIELTGTGGASTNLIVPANKKLYFIFNNSTGAVTVKVSGQTGVSVPTGKKMVLVSNGTDIVNGLNYIADFASNSATITHLSATSATITNLTLTSLVISNLSIASANITTLTSASATITNLLATSLAVSSIATFAAGSAAAPSITTTGDTNTGLFFPAADTIAFTEGGAEAMRIDSSGQVGIGTASPGYKLDVVGGTRVAETAAQNGYEVAPGSTNILTSYNRTTSTWLPLRQRANQHEFYCDGVERLRLDSSGNLGLGVTPTASNACTNIELPYGATLSARSNTTAPQFAMMSNAVGNWYEATYKINGFATQYTQQGFTGTHAWYTAPSGTAGNAISFTQAMTLTAAGGLLVGNTSAQSYSGTAPITELYTTSINNTDPDGGTLALYSTSSFAIDKGAGTVFGFKYNTAGNFVTAARVRGAKENATDGNFAGYLAFDTRANGGSLTERARITAAGELALGTPTATNTLTVQGTVAFNVNSTTDVFKYFTGGAGLVYAGTTTSTAIGFITNGGEKARITAAGDLLVGTTSYLVSSNEKASFDCGSTNGVASKTSGGASSWNYFAWNSATSGNNGFIEFGTEGSYTARGSITYNRAGGLVAYNVTSDYRAKDILGPVQNSGATIDALKVYEGQMKGATQSRPMLVAHEAQEHAPYAVTGEKDAVNEDGTPKHQQMDVSALVPLLLAELQSLRKRVAELESK